MHMAGQDCRVALLTRCLRCSYTLNDTSNIANSTFNTIKEREGFIISPFTIPISTSAVKYTLEKDGYKVEPAFDIATRSPFLSVEKFLSDKNVLAKASYAFRDEVAMLEFGYRPDEKDFPLARVSIFPHLILLIHAVARPVNDSAMQPMKLMSDNLQSSLLTMIVEFPRI